VLKLRSLAVLGIALAFPLAAVANAPDRDAAQSVTVAANDVDARLPDAKPVAGRDAAARTDGSDARSEIRGRRTWEPAIGFQNPYAFPLQTIPISIPAVTGLGF